MAKIIRELILEFYERFEAKKALNENILERILRGKKRIMRAGQIPFDQENIENSSTLEEADLQVFKT